MSAHSEYLAAPFDSRDDAARCASCGCNMATPRDIRDQPCEAARIAWSDGEPITDATCVACCAEGRSSEERDCAGDCTHLIARRAAA